MKTTFPARIPRRPLALGALVAGLLAASLGVGAGEARAAYKVKLDTGTLKISGDAASDKLVLRLEPGSPTTLQLDVGADGTADFSFDRSTFTAIVVEAGAGDDWVRVDQSNGSFPDEALTMSGGDGADTLLGGSGTETLLGGKGSDVVAGGDGNDRALLGDGDDRFQWNPGDDSDVVEGQGGKDLLDFFGSGANETVDVSANGSRVRFTRDVAGVTMDLNDVERIGFRAFGGTDTITVDDLTGTDARTVALDLNGVGGGGDAQIDTVTARGTEGADRVNVGSAAGDVVVSGLSAQVQVAGSEALDSVNVATRAGSDTITTGVGVSGPSINVDGGDDPDTMRYNGTAAADTIDVVANGTAVSTISPATALLNTTAVESLVVLGLGGTDTIAGGGNLALLTALTIDGGEGNDTLTGGNGADLLLGGSGNDAVDGNQGNDSALLGDGDDRFAWNPGDGSDTFDGQAGSDVLDFFGSNASETTVVAADGQRVRLTRDIAGITMDFDNVEALTLHAFGGTDLISVDDLTGTDLKTAELDLNAGGGGGDAQPDTVVVSGTGGADLVDVGSAAGAVLVSGLSAQVQVAGGEAALDNVTVAALAGNDTLSSGVGVSGPVINLDGGDGTDSGRYNGTAAADTIALFANGGAVSTYEAATASVNTIAIESLLVLGHGGADTVGATGNLAPLTVLTVDGGEGDDTLNGGNGADLLLGGSGNDTVDGNQGNDSALLGDGDDRFAWNPGDGSDTIDGQAGSDVLDFFGSNASETTVVAAEGKRVRLTRSVAGITLDLGTTEALTLHAFGGADTITVDDLTGTDLRTAELDLNAGGGGGDAQPDTIVTNGTNRSDVVQVNRSASEVLVSGLAAQASIAGSEAALDTLLVQTLGGNDDVTVAPAVSELITTVVNLGADE